MIGILNKIIADKYIEIERRKAAISLDQLREKVTGLDKCRNFFKAVTKPNKRGLNVIAEVKKASPSAGVIRDDFNAVEIAKIYEVCGADAISVLTDEKYFQGRLEYLSQVKKAVSLPVLRKDFIIDPWQVYESRAAGADAILLIAEALPSGKLSDMMITASQLSLTVLLEVHEIQSLLRVRSMVGFPRAGYSMLGINNRNLATMEVDINTTSRLAEFIKAEGFVSESGIKSPEDVEKLIKIGASAVLIGQNLCESDSIEEKFGELFG